MARLLEEDFFKDLLDGDLEDCLDYVRTDNTLDLEIRENYINIYYRGGNILKVNKKENCYQYEFDYNYFKDNSVFPKIELDKMKNLTDWNNYFPKAKQAMDFYFSEHRNEEREFQQLVVRENNYSSIANGTDYFIIDIEYDNHKNARFDIIAIKWPSEASKRRLTKNYKPKLVVIEMKYGDGSLSGNAGMKKHDNDFSKFISNLTDLNNFKKEMLYLFRQKRALGLIPCLSKLNNANEIIEFADDIEFAFLIANHDPASQILIAELLLFDNIKVNVIVSNFMGYGIYNHCVYELSEFKQLFKNQIYAL
jgi:hypothetical protein